MSDVSVRDAARQALEGIGTNWRAVTTGPRGGDHWYVCEDDASIAMVTANDGSDEHLRQPRAEFIAAAPELLRGLLAELDQADGNDPGYDAKCLDCGHHPDSFTHQDACLTPRIRIRDDLAAALSTLQKVRARIALAEKWTRHLSPGDSEWRVSADNLDILLADVVRILDDGGAQQ